MESPRLKSKFKWPDQTLVGRCRPWATKNLLIYIFANFPKHLHSARIHKYSWGILIWNRSRSFMNNHYSTKLISCKISGAQHTYLPRNWTHHLAFRIFPSVHRLTQFSSYINPASYKWSVWIPWTATKTRGPFTWTNLHKAIPVSLTCTRLLPPLGLPNLFTWPERRQIPEGWDQLLG